MDSNLEVSMMKQRIVSLLILLVLAFSLTMTASAETTSFAFDKTTVQLFEGETLATVLTRSGDAAEGEVTYTSSAPRNATVDASGVVTGLQKGRTTITATLKTDKRSFRATIGLTIARKVTSLEVDESKLSTYAADDPAVSSLLTQTVPEGARVLVLPLAKTQKLTISALPKDANDRSVTVTSDNTVIVSNAGTVTLRANALGECNVTIASVQNPEITQVYHVLVVQPVSKLTASVDAAKLFIGQTTQVSVAYTPDTATVKEATYASKNPKIAVVDENGVVTALSKGTATIEVTAADGSAKKTSVRVVVKQQPEGISLNKTDLTINVGKTARLSASVTPASTNDKSVVWTSSDESIATVTSTGTVKALTPGVCTITCASRDFPTITATATVQVQQPVTRVAFTEKSISFDVNTTFQSYYEIEPSTATNQGVTFSSSNEKIATVDQNGVITGHMKGTCTITVKTTDGSKRKGTMKVSILQPVTGVHMSKAEYRVGIDESTRIRAILEPTNASNTNMSWSIADTSIATVRGGSNRPLITGKSWGTTTITGTTEDGGYTTSATIHAGNYDKAVVITDLYVSDNKIKIVAKNKSDMNITKFFFTVTCYDMLGNPAVCNTDGSALFTGSYRYTLYEGDSTTHGRFTFDNYVDPDVALGRVTITLTGYRTDDGYSRDIAPEKQTVVEYINPLYTGEK